MEVLEWKFDDFFQNDESFFKELELVKNELSLVSNNSEKDSLYDCLKIYYDLSYRVEKLFTYATLKSDLDISNQTYIAYKNDIHMVQGLLDNFLQSINRIILSSGDVVDDFLKQDSRLVNYKMHLYEVLRLKKHNVTNHLIEQNTLLIPKINNLYSIIQNSELEYKCVDIHGSMVPMDSSNYEKYFSVVSSNTRRKMLDACMESLGTVNKSISNLLELRLQLCYGIAREKGYTSVLEQVLDEDDLSIDIITNLKESTNSYLPVLERYYSLKKKVINKDKLYSYDLVSSHPYQRNLSFSESLTIVKEALSIFGKDYLHVLDQVLQDGVIDVYPKKGKFTGSYHWRNYTKPMILMNYTDTFRNVFVVAHELGHAVNGYMIKENHPFQDFHFSVFLSEIASKTNELILGHYLITHANAKNEKLYLLGEQISTFIQSVFQQVMYFEFNEGLYQKIENKEMLSTDDINELFYHLRKKYSPGVAIGKNEQYRWQNRLHLFYEQYRYYNFQYATGLLIALKIATDIINQKNNMLDKYLKFLTVGGSMPTLDSLKIMGIDFSKDDVFEDGFQYFSQLLDQYEELILKS